MVAFRERVVVDGRGVVATTYQRVFQRDGWSMRNLDKRAGLDAAAKAAGVTPTILTLDVQDSASVARVAATS